MDKDTPVLDQVQLDKLNQKLERKTKEVEIIQQVSSQINATLNLQNIANTMLELMDEFFGFKHTMILLLEEKEQILNILATHGYEDQGIGAKVKVGMGVIGMVAKRRKLMRMANLGAQRAYMQAVKQQVNQTTTTKIQEEEVLPGLQDVESQVAIPMMLEEKLVGVFSVESREINIFDKGDELLIGILANQAAIALQHARLFQREQQRLHELNEAHKELADLNSNLEQKVEERTAELMELSAKLSRYFSPQVYDSIFSGKLDVKNGKISEQVSINGKSLVSSAELTAKAFSQGILGQYGGKLVAIALLLFAFSTSITWCYYGDRSTAYIFGEKAVFWYRNFYVLCFVLAAVIDTTIVWNIAYVSVALVSIPNLIALFFLRKEVKELSDEYS